MRIALLALGSRGDVQPFVALALALLERGHTVRLLATADFAALAEGYGLPFAALAGSISELMDRDLALDAVDSASGRLPLGFARRFGAQITPLLPPLARDCVEGCVGSELIVASTLGMYIGVAVAERLGVPLVPAHFHPYGATAELADFAFPAAPRGMPLRGLYNRLTHGLARHGLWQLLHGPLNTARQAIGLPPIRRIASWRIARRAPPLALYAYSAQLAARPADWPAYRQVTGYWFLDSPEPWQPPEDLLRFLAAGPPPVYIGFGSLLAGRDPAAITHLLAAALGQAGQRGIIYRGTWGDLDAGELPATVLRVGETPHSWLFPQVAAVVCHGGAGTVAAALRAGVPVATIPAYGDMAFWARRAAELGAGPEPIPRREVSVERLAAAITEACANPAIRARAAELGALIAAEHGAARAAMLLERLARNVEAPS